MDIERGLVKTRYGYIHYRAAGSGGTPVFLFHINQQSSALLLELMAVRARAVVVPFEGGVETEQRLRADLLAEIGALEVVAEAELSTGTLAAAIGRALARPRDAVPAVDLGGARATGALVARAVRDRAAA